MPLKVVLRSLTEAEVDAGLHDEHLYDKALHPLRAKLRRLLLPGIRKETPILASFQAKVRRPLLDKYFVWTANLGTHTFFMVGLPLTFWFGYSELGRSLVNVIAFGVFWAAFIKDLLCLPRPLSPPIHRLSMSRSTSLEYGFPSTHTANSVAVALFCWTYIVEHFGGDENNGTRVFSLILLCVYATSVTFGRIYCGMHSVTDICGGAILAVVLYFVQLQLRHSYEALIASPHPYVFLVVPVLLGLVGLHPDPVDRCPCFEDSVCFMGVLMGLIPGSWAYAHSSFSWQEPALATVPFDSKVIGIPIAIMRLVFGVSILFIWRIIVKKICYFILPPIYSAFNLPHRRFEIAARNYKSLHHERIHPIPSVLDLQNLNTSMKSSDHVGVQSSIDLREQLSVDAQNEIRARAGEAVSNSRPHTPADTGLTTHLLANTFPPTAPSSPIPPPSGVDIKVSPPSYDATRDSESLLARRDGKPCGTESELIYEDAPLRYDIDIVTKLIVYAGIGWLAVHTIPILFEVTGLGMGVRQQ